MSLAFLFLCSVLLSMRVVYILHLNALATFVCSYLCSLTGDARTFVFTVSVCLLCFFLLAVARFVLLFCFSAFCLPAFWFCSMSYLENIIRLAFLSLFILGFVLIVFTSWFHCICMCFAFCICFLFLVSFLFSCCSVIQPALTLPSFSSACSTNLER